MKRIHIILAFAFVILCNGCYVTRSDFFTNKMMNIHQGMSQQEVVTILGEPTYRSFGDDVEKWEFRKPVIAGWSVAMVYFADGKVDKLDSFFEQENKFGVNNVLTPSSAVVMSSESEKHKPGSFIVTPEGKQVTVLHSSPGVVVTTEGEHILMP